MTPAQMAQTHAAAFTASRPWSAAEFEALLTNRFTHTAGDARCFAVYTLIADQAELLAIATDPAFQRQGLAQRCMELWQKEAAANGARRAFLDVAEDNTPALSLYQRCGYARCGVRRAYYLRDGGLKLDAIAMERALP
ncbi:GNAT family N-acetyltransferase [Ruegeria sp. 2012CJ41-6]|uniref:GNAT family N-acetyltransferase n=1 Tax=Ruegeria spongiae TaxID=2942209 RepID=A0ABT0PZA4_9RHOB|nr:N-acetyltransferase [Ruegeria spongiae]MCL6282915.1 GNAT family N-acetyltransferase [Ruegeria spongiae]